MASSQFVAAALRAGQESDPNQHDPPLAQRSPNQQQQASFHPEDPKHASLRAAAPSENEHPHCGLARNC
ncbi:MAG TPA: hypothetical protein VF086_12155 [Propionibacteriaceae bacterium]